MPANIFDRIIEMFPALTKSETKIADYLLSHRSEVQYMTISELAKACHVAEATISRFGRSLQCRGFSDLRLSIAQASVPESSRSAFTYYGEVLPEDSIEQKCQKILSRNVETLHQTLELLSVKSIEAAVTYMSQATIVYCLGQGNSSIIAMEAWGRFSLVSPSFHWVSDSHLQAVSVSLLRPNDVVLYFSYSGSTKACMEMVELVKQHKLRMILVTRFPKSPAAKQADVVLVCGSNESPLQQGSVSAKIAQLYIIDVLFNEYCSQNLDLVVDNRKKSADAVTPKHL